MTLRCLICESTAVLPQHTANTAVVLIGTLESIMRGMACASTPDTRPEGQPESRLLQLVEQIGQGVSTALAECSAITAFAKDVQKYQFSHHDYLCLRCGALFNQSACTESSSSTPITPASIAQSGAQPTPAPSADPQESTASATD
ncbi:hypothetical protein D3C78_1340920 [compost metagenome]|jgi:hypothetical protein